MGKGPRNWPPAPSSGAPGGPARSSLWHGAPVSENLEGTWCRSCRKRFRRRPPVLGHRQRAPYPFVRRLIVEIAHLPGEQVFGDFRVEERPLNEPLHRRVVAWQRRHRNPHGSQDAAALQHAVLRFQPDFGHPPELFVSIGRCRTGRLDRGIAQRLEQRVPLAKRVHLGWREHLRQVAGVALKQVFHLTQPEAERLARRGAAGVYFGQVRDFVGDGLGDGGLPAAAGSLVAANDGVDLVEPL